MTEKKLTKNISFSSYWARMFKKYIFLLILSFFPVQSFAGSCPDGSDPVKNISIENLEAGIGNVSSIEAYKLLTYMFSGTIIRSKDNRKAIVVTPNQDQYVLAVGDYFSSEDAVIKEINADEVIVIDQNAEEYFFKVGQAAGTYFEYNCDNNTNASSITASDDNDLGLTIESEFANINEHGYVMGGIFVIWWDKKYNMLSEAKLMLEDLKKVRNKSIDLGMRDPPNVDRGVYTNIYLHTPFTFGDAWSNKGWGAGVGTNKYDVPFLTFGKDTAHNLISLYYHEGFHIMQYNRNSFPYSEDTAWYIETTASWFTIVNLMKTRKDIDYFVGATTLTLNPQLALWHSFANRAPGDPVDWLYEVRQYALEAYLYYLTEVEGFDSKYITNGFYSNISISPQEYLLQKGGAQYRNYFANWAAANTADLNYLKRYQVTRAKKEADQYGNSAYRNEYALEIDGKNANGTYAPPQDLRPRSWAYNVIKVEGSASNSFKINFNGQSKGSEGASSYFKARIVKKSGEIYDISEFKLNDDNITGQIKVSLNNNENEFYIVVVSVPNQFTGNQTYNYKITINNL